MTGPTQNREDRGTEDEALVEEYAKVFYEKTGVEPSKLTVVQDDPMDAAGDKSVIVRIDDVEVLHVPLGDPSSLTPHRYLDGQHSTFRIRLEVACTLGKCIATLEIVNDGFGSTAGVARMFEALFPDTEEQWLSTTALRILRHLRKAREMIASMVFHELDDMTITKIGSLLRGR